MTINVKRLQELKACKDQIKKFQEIFGDADAPLSIEVAVQHGNVFDWNWAALNLLSKEGNKKFQEAKELFKKAYLEAKELLKKAYQEAVAPHQKAYLEPAVPLEKAYLEAAALLEKAYLEAAAPLEKAYLEAAAPHKKACKEAVARTFAEIYISENQ